MKNSFESLDGNKKVLVSHSEKCNDHLKTVESKNTKKPTKSLPYWLLEYSTKKRAFEKQADRDHYMSYIVNCSDCVGTSIFKMYTLINFVPH